MFSKACEYGIRATIFITQKSLDNYRVSLKDIAFEIDSPVAFTAKVLQQLAKHKIINSIKGPAGGFEISTERLKEIKLNEIVDAIDGDEIYRGCALGLQQCNVHKPCPMHDKFALIRDELQGMLEKTSLHELTTGLYEGLTFLKR